MSHNFINYTIGRLIEDLRKIIQAGVIGVVNEVIEKKFHELEDIHNRIIEIERILEKFKQSQTKSGGELPSSDVQGLTKIQNRVCPEYCNYEGCSRPVFSRGFCKNHYYQLKRKGLLKNIEARKEKKRCVVENCDKFAISKGFCKNHYYQFKRGSLVFENNRYVKKES
ncbi:MAG: hypothetical protein N2746_01585 [Deltaproteobacteria bacterium]|nr:hypothetical protein [Deltaproteobacteria bacterium]